MRIVIKIGTQAIASKKGLEKNKIALLVQEVAEIMKQGHEIVLVSSGAIGSGLPYLHFESPLKKKVAAAVGQPVLMHAYIEEAKKNKILVGQILVLSDDFTNPERNKNFALNIREMLRRKIIPIINENDVMKKGDLRIGDNDMFSAMVASDIRADKLILLTNQKGFYNANPDTNKSAELIKIITKINKKIEKFCSKNKSNLGRGGMITKIKAAKYATERGIEVLVGEGGKKGTIASALSKNFSGTKFLANSKNK